MTASTRFHLPRRYALAILAVLAFPAAAVAADQRPDASFSFSPQDPRAGQTVQFTSSSCDPDGRLTRQAWDLDGDGAYDDAEGPLASWTFTNSGANSVGLEVTDARGATDTARRTVVVDTIYAIPKPDSTRLMTPFPVVRLAGRLTRTGARIKVLSVLRAPKCARVSVRCRGKSCPIKRASGFVGRGPLRFRRFEHRLKAGTVLTIRVSKDAFIGKFTQFRIRKDIAPRRRDRCLLPGARKGTPCPRD